jgi:hypothetical protein
MRLVPAALTVVGAFVLSLAGAATGVAQAADPAALPGMAAHRAIYTLKLDPQHSGDVMSATGTMAYEVEDSCDGWATRQRLDMTVTNNQGQPVQMVSDYATWEAKDGRSFRFHLKQTTEEAVTSEIDGQAHLDGPDKGGSVHYDQPHDSTVPLPPGTLFPMAHTEALIAAAAEGKKFIALPLFDGTTDTGVQDSSIVVLKWAPPEATTYPLLSPLPSARVHLAFFDPGPKGQTPDYEVSMRYWANGVADDLAMNFGNFTMDGEMTSLAPVPKRC